MNRALLTLCCLLSCLPAAAEPGPRCGGEAATPGNLQLQVGKSSMLRLPEAVLARSVGNPAVVQAMLVAPDTLYVVGVDVGSTNMIIQGKSGVCSVVNVGVSMDPAGLQATLAALMPEEKAIRVTAVADTLVLSGTVQDAGAVLRATELAHAYVRRASVPLALPKPADGGAQPALAAAAPGAGTGGAGSRIINMLDVSAPQQVMLAVQIAEVSKSLLERLEVGATLRLASGSWATTLLSNFLSGTANGLLDVRKSNGQQLTIEAQKQDGLVRILAEPTVMAISGQEGSFLAGGKIFIPVGQDNNKITLEEREYGVGLRFTPTVLAGGRINLKVAPEVSELSREGVGISAAGVSGRSILPVITTRRASTTVQLYDGQSYAIGGLIKNNQVSNITGLPWLSEVPILGALFRSTDFQHDRTELLFVITAHLVKPLPADVVLPTAQLAPPSRTDLMLRGKMEGPLPASLPPPVPPLRAANGFELK
ncbi:outer membrane channel protein [Janthinobacterium sp. BJB1]|uniref:type II and III secretion system protein family protein n=3 Tax=Janthinobacterium sp. GW458P TaxID=1981504 RepID=UPI000C0DE5A2|nr:type II and III secretion system protein family protein [Janthinobacterium sp. GW458P]MBE3026505.1 type II and III secretion system protein family protein [Janthinobacterium sp. GW458P]PJC95801.1 outer membrane channel protein [Janthinobacterium sp. BJB1]